MAGLFISPHVSSALKGTVIFILMKDKVSQVSIDGTFNTQHPTGLGFIIGVKKKKKEENDIILVLILSVQSTYKFMQNTLIQ